ncbi:MAG TPA: D-aminopeptidase [Acetobacteraceae bacterium]|nr:D-aminopeptidase [Acetobacteraceae bacterium]
MTSSLAARIEHCLEALPRAYPGPGGAVAVLRAGEVLARHAWGWANAERRIAFTPRTLFRMCSITKQFTCALVLDAFPDPSVLDGDVRARLALREEKAPSASQLCHNQSGLRDYWAVAMLHGAPAESAFGEIEAARVIGGARTLQFAPGTRYSYANQNFRILSDIVQERSGRSFSELLRQRIFAPIGMESALLAADTRAMPDGTEGYEGSVSGGFRAAESRILWTGDAGLGASLDDMIAWERHIDATREDAASLYGRLSAPVRFADGAKAAYGFGLARANELGRAVTGHGGALRGWRSHRMYLPAERISVVVMFNHLSDAHEAAVDVLAAVLGEERKSAAGAAPQAWLGAYTEPETGLAVRIDTAGTGQVRLRYGHVPERLDMQADGTAKCATARLRVVDGGLWMDRPNENQSSLLVKCEGQAARDVAGRYECGELGAALTVADAGGALYGGFSGFLGQGRMEMLEPVGGDVWTLPCPRALDHTPPGDWTLAFRRDAAGRVAGATVGCWLARRLAYVRVG